MGSKNSLLLAITLLLMLTVSPLTWGQQTQTKAPTLLERLKTAIKDRENKTQKPSPILPSPAKPKEQAQAQKSVSKTVSPPKPAPVNKTGAKPTPKILAKKKDPATKKQTRDSDDIVETKNAKIIQNTLAIQKQVETHKALALASGDDIKNAAQSTSELKKDVETKIQNLPLRALLPEPPTEFPTPAIRENLFFGFDPNAKMTPPSMKLTKLNSPSELNNKYTQANFQAAQSKLKYLNLSSPLKDLQVAYRKSEEASVQLRMATYSHYYFSKNKNYRFAYKSWFERDFVGGYFYPVRPWSQVENDFVYPEVHWLFSNQWAFDFYEAWFGDFYASRDPVKPFKYAGIWFPTETLKNLAIDISGLFGPLGYRQAAFRTSFTLLTDLLDVRISENTLEPFIFAKNEIVLTHYENIKNLAVVVEGFVDRATLHIPFKGLIDLENPSRTMVYVPVGSAPEFDTNFFYLNQINRNISRLGWDAATIYDEPPSSEGPFQNRKCETFLNEDKFSANDEDVGSAYEKTIQACLNKSASSKKECVANIWCDDGRSYFSPSTCSAVTHKNSFMDSSRDIDLAKEMAIAKCLASPGADKDECQNSVICKNSAGATINTTTCSTSSLGSKNQQKSFSNDSLEPQTARVQTIEDCRNDSETDDDQCSWNLVCH